MSNKLIINAMLPETRISLVQDGEIQDLLIERDSDVGIVGNIYKGKVLRVLPGMQAAFVDIGQERAAFLYVDDVYYPDMEKPLKTGMIPDKVIVPDAPEDKYSQAIASSDSTVSSNQPTSSGIEASGAEQSAAPANAQPTGTQQPNNNYSNFRGRRPFNRNNRTNPNNQNGAPNNNGRRNFRNNRGGQAGPNNNGRRPQRNPGARPAFNNQQGPYNRNLMNQRPQYMHNFNPTSPEEYAAQQNMLGKQMLDISEEEYLAEMEAKRQKLEAMKAAQENQANTSPKNQNDDADDSIGNRIDTNGNEVSSNEDLDTDFLDEATEESIEETIEESIEVTAPEVIEPKVEEKPQVYASNPAPEKTEEPIARGFVPLEDDLDSEADESADSAAIYRAEPMIDLDAWVSEVEAVQAANKPEPDAIEQSIPAENATATENVAATPGAADTAVTTSPSVRPAHKKTFQKTPHHHGDRNRQRNNRSRNQDEDDDFMPRRRREPVKIEDIVKEGMEILVQVAKDPIATKGARLTCHVSLPGRYLVFMPSVDHIGVSRRIESDYERRRLKEIINHIRPEKTGVIVRTASGKQTDEKLKEDLDYIVQAWNEIQRKFKKQKAPTVVYQDLNIVLRSIRDIVNDKIDEIIVDSDREFKNIQRFISRFVPHMKDKLTHYKGNMPIYDYYGIEPEIERALEKRVWLKSGGYIVIDQAEALVAIDVNTGRFVGKKNLEETILKTNLEAVKEIAYQMRLRNCGGIIIMDLIDMEKESNKEKVFKLLEEELKKDRARPTIMRISQLGLVEMTRKRTRDTIVRSLCQPCTHCKGRGFVKNPLTISYDILRDIEREGHDKDTIGVTVQCHPDVADILQGEKGDVVERLEHDFGKKISIRSNGAYPLEHYEMVAHREDGKSEAMNYEERRQKLRQKINLHLQKLEAENKLEIKNLSAINNDAEVAEGSADKSAESTGATSNEGTQSDKSAGRNFERRPQRPHGKNRNGGRFQNKRNHRNPQNASVEGANTEVQPKVANSAEGVNENSAQVQATEVDSAAGISNESSKPQRSPKPNRGFNDRGDRAGRSGSGKFNKNSRRPSGGPGRSNADAGADRNADAPNRMSRWDYVKQKYFGDDKEKKAPISSEQTDKDSGNKPSE